MPGLHMYQCPLLQAVPGKGPLLGQALCLLAQWQAPDLDL